MAKALILHFQFVSIQKVCSNFRIKIVNIRHYEIHLFVYEKNGNKLMVGDCICEYVDSIL